METKPPSDLLTLLQTDSPACAAQIEALQKSLVNLQQDWPPQIQQMVQLFASIENEQVATSLPAWHARALKHFSRILFPALETIGSKCSPAQREGLFFGHIMALLNAVETSKEFEKWLSPKTLAAAKEFGSAFRPLMNIVLAEVMSKPIKESSDFFKGFTHALDNTLDRNGWFKGWTDASLLYFIIALVPDVIKNLPSVVELHKLFCKVAKRTWDFARTQKFCTRIGLKLRMQGRPRKTGHSPK